MDENESATVNEFLVVLTIDFLKIACLLAEESASSVSGTLAGSAFKNVSLRDSDSFPAARRNLVLISLG
jgi:hypothetical protein